MSMALEYRFAEHFSRALLLLRRNGRPNWHDRSAACRMAARDVSLPAGKLLAVQEFAARMWVIAMAAGGAGFAVVVLAGYALPNGGVRTAASYLILICVVASIIAMAEMSMISYRANQTRRFVLRGGPQAALAMSQPQRGQPRGSDFWIIFAITLAGCLLIFYGLSHQAG
jgi:hypothetical protein